MIIANQEDVTKAVLAEMHRTPDARTKEILAALVRHLHGFIREVRLTEREFQEAIALVNAVGQRTTPSHNEAMLMSGALGVSNLVCLLNNGADGTRETQANNLGPFWRTGSPRVPSGGSLLRSATPGEALFFTGWVRDAEGGPIEGAEVDVWHSSPVGLYENQDPTQAEMNLRGTLTTDADGLFAFRSVKPGAYPVPIEGPTGVLLAAQKRHNWRPAHLHFLIFKPGFKTIASQVYTDDDPYLETDSQFGVTKALIGHYVKHENEPAPAPDVPGKWWSLEHSFELEPGESWLPKPPISKKVEVRV
ncbi:MAG TPA: dioxygenase [Burkholderiales bacterium]|nr:dioxygenase [Burkholderiales bacterium]